MVFVLLKHSVFLVFFGAFTVARAEIGRFLPSTLWPTSNRLNCVKKTTMCGASAEQNGKELTAAAIFPDNEAILCVPWEAVKCESPTYPELNDDAVYDSVSAATV